MTLPTFRTVQEMRDQVAAWRHDGLRIGVVFTMGNLHEGHMSLIDAALENTNRVITTIFVNPTQFGEGEDLDSYPRTETRDTEMVAERGGHAMFVPSVSEMYPTGFTTRVLVDGLTDVLCGQARPGHFDGVAQIVTKLLNQAQADATFFGEKDWQQFTVVKRLALDLDIPTEIRGVPVARDEYGLALSSRNGYLSQEEIEIARKFNVILKKAAYDIGTGGFASDVCEKAAEAILKAGFEKVDYVECRDPDTLELVEKAEGHACRIFGAAHLGRARLIDNHLVN
ncbi:pantoate--beta-alanine ligase [Amylibacter sp. SFDW26]|uniref:pantoate--beta-alanine ligase n=1 Tax=Amylibacter sp. SFDW26 TaxID=2652722 RepID=UPI0012623711|nr:pantoate--beta-alanine ligase [Amylibacter sp. SFDW26]KAB7613732.1 pantoate--beta-alanine ligase [Amylibacter sp. SFDW26]